MKLKLGLVVVGLILALAVTEWRQAKRDGVQAEDWLTWCAAEQIVEDCAARFAEHGEACRRKMGPVQKGQGIDVTPFRRCLTVGPEAYRPKNPHRERARRLDGLK